MPNGRKASRIALLVGQSEPDLPARGGRRLPVVAEAQGQWAHQPVLRVHARGRARGRPHGDAAAAAPGPILAPLTRRAWQPVGVPDGRSAGDGPGLGRAGRARRPTRDRGRHPLRPGHRPLRSARAVHRRVGGAPALDHRARRRDPRDDARAARARPTRPGPLPPGGRADRNPLPRHRREPPGAPDRQSLQAVARQRQRRAAGRRERAAAHALHRSPVRPRVHQLRERRRAAGLARGARGVAEEDGRAGGQRVNVGGFSEGQRRYLEFHRESVFLQAVRR